MPQSYCTPGLPAPLVVLAFLGTGFFLVAALLGALATLALGRHGLARRLSLAGLGCGSLYLAALAAFSLASRDRVLRQGDRKYFCEMDCHLAYSLEGVSRTKVLGTPPRTVTARGIFAVATLRTWFDEKTISPRRGGALLTPNPRVAYVVDDSGRRYDRSPAAEEAFADPRHPSAPLSRRLRPGESCSTTLVFDLPEEVRAPRLLIVDAPGVELFLIDHENSLFHRKISFAL